MNGRYIARFKHAPGRYLVEHEGGGSYGGQKIMNRRQEKYGNHPDPATGLYLHEMYRCFSTSELISIKPFVREE
jgi:hypothetical protein